jgi:hypothetical protein
MGNRHCARVEVACHAQQISMPGKSSTWTLKNHMSDSSDAESDAQLKQELVRFCGWDRRKIFGPRPYVDNCLEHLEYDDLVESRFEITGEFPESSHYAFWWRK